MGPISYDVTEYTVHIKWLEPNAPNGMIILYEVNYKRLGDTEVRALIHDTQAHKQTRTHTHTYANTHRYTSINTHKRMHARTHKQTNTEHWMCPIVSLNIIQSLCALI